MPATTHLRSAIAMAALSGCVALTPEDLGLHGSSGPRPADSGKASPSGIALSPIASPNSGQSPNPSSAPIASPTAADPNCTQPGCLRAYSLSGMYSKPAIQAFMDPGVAIDNGVNAYTIRYYTDGRESLATVAIPSGVPTPINGWHIVENNHPTSGLDDPCALSGTLLGLGLAGLFGTRGTISVAPDHPGLGTLGLQPYLISQSEGRSALDAIRATRSLARILEQSLSNLNAMVGLSQGGHATLAAAAQLTAYAPELEIRAFGVTAPASAWESQWSQEMQEGGPRLVYLALAFYSWWNAAGQGQPNPWLRSQRSGIDALMTGQCLVAKFGPSLSTSLPANREDLFDPVFLEEFRTRNWSQFTYIRDAFAANALKPFQQTAPIRIYQGDADATVKESATREVREALNAAGMAIDYQVVAGGTHTNVAFGFMNSPTLRDTEGVAWIMDRLKTP